MHQHTSSRVTKTVAVAAALVLVLCAFPLASARDVKCDDLEPLLTSCQFDVTDNLEQLFRCSSDEVLARQLGCYRCVSKTTCLRTKRNTHIGVRVSRGETPSAAIAAATDAPSAPVSALAALDVAQSNALHAGESGKSTNDVELSLPFIPDALSMAESAQFNGVDVATSGLASRQTVSNWFFMALVMLALASIGLAARSRVIKQQSERFERIVDSDDEINPFCDSVHNPQDDDNGDIELAVARYTVTNDDDGDDDDVSKRCRDDDDECVELRSAQPFTGDDYDVSAIEAGDCRTHRSADADDNSCAIVVSSSCSSVMSS